jgi:catechol 2,3-dioxygenase-like lactoylglutathione lyase family enzyme
MARGSISHIALAVSDLERSAAFYDKVFEFIGLKRVEVPEATQQAMKTRLRAWVGSGYSISIRPSKGEFARRPHDRNAPGSNHMAFTAEDRSDVEKTARAPEANRSDDTRRTGGISVLARILRGLFYRS